MDELREKIRMFARERDWEKFHTPKNLAIGLSVEASELLEIFTWLSPEESATLPQATQTQVEEEIGDILIYLLNFCDKLGIDPVGCAHRKLEINGAKYPVNKAYGSAKKYSL